MFTLTYTLTDAYGFRYSNDSAVTDELLLDLWNGTVDVLIDVGRKLNAQSQVPVFAVTNGFFDDWTRGGAILPGYRCPRPYENMFAALQSSGIAWMRFYEFQWPTQDGGNCDLVLRTAAREAAAGVPLIVHGVAEPPRSKGDVLSAPPMITGFSARGILARRCEQIFVLWGIIQLPGRRMVVAHRVLCTVRCAGGATVSCAMGQSTRGSCATTTCTWTVQREGQVRKS